MMADIVFSSWQGQIVDNRGKSKEEFEEVPGLSLPLEYDGENRIKAFMGWDGLAIRDADVNMVDMCRAYMEAVQKESCGKCIPCRVGTRVILTALKRITDGHGTRADLEEMESLGGMIWESSKCQVGQTGTIALLHSLQYYRDEFLDLIDNKKKAPSGTYKVKTVAPCSNACPTHLDVPTYVEYVKDHRFDDSLNVIRNMTCLPGTLGRVCLRPCESNCRRANLDEPISIKCLKRFVADWESERRHVPSLKKPEAKKEDSVAVVGSGPAGLSCAYYLAQMGYTVTVFERFGAPGGMAAWGIPDYRLPREVLRKDIAEILESGIEVRNNTPIGDGISLNDLTSQYDAVFLAVGAQLSRRLDIEGTNQKDVLWGVDFLKDVKLGREVSVADRVVVIGGGNVAIDVALTARRLGAREVHLACLEKREEMPATEWECQVALAEGVVFHTSWGPNRILGSGDRVTGIELVKCTSVFDDQGRFNPSFDPSTTMILDADMVIMAIGQAIDLRFLEGMTEIETTRGKTLVVNPETFETSAKGIFSAGDCVTGPDMLVRAAGDGKRAADKIDKYLRGEPVEPPDEDRLEDLMATIGVYDKEEEVGMAGGQERKQLEMLDPEERRHTFAEVEIGFPIPIATEEAERCLRCYRIGLVALGPKS